MPVSVKTSEITPSQVPNLIQVPQAIEIKMDQLNSFIEENKKPEIDKRIGKFNLFFIFILISSQK
jgi:hypothetical protein